MSTPKATPMIKQYLSIKEKYKDAILFYRMGDFYEMFFEDAELASRVLEITLTSRNKNDSVPVPMCGVPYRAAQGYIAKLIDNGYKVAICDQVEDPAKAKGLVRRKVVRVITPGMILDNELLDSKSNNFVLAVCDSGQLMGLAYLDISTGVFRLTETRDPKVLCDEINRIRPREILVPGRFDQARRQELVGQDGNRVAVTCLEDELFSAGQGRRRLCSQLGTMSLEGFGCRDFSAALGAAGALLEYVQQTQKQEIPHIRQVAPYFLEKYLVMDQASRRNLELERNLHDGGRRGSLLGVIDKTVTAMGGRRLKHWLRYPLIDPELIEARLEAVDQICQDVNTRRQIRKKLEAVYDLERLNAKIAMRQANGRDLLALKRSLEQLPAIWQALKRFGAQLLTRRPDLEGIQGLVELIERAIRQDAPVTINEGGMIRTGFNPELDALIKISRDVKGYLAGLESREREATGIGSLKVRFNKVFGYYIEVSKAHSDSVPSHYVRKQTLVNAERYITDELKQFETKVLNAEQERAALELELFNGVREQVAACSDQIQAVADFVARLDCLSCLAQVADENNYHRPVMANDGVIEIEQGRHPVVEKLMTEERFVPNTIRLDNQRNQVLVITGPNMAGKSTVLRQVALIVLLAQMGSFVPATKAHLSITDRIFTRVGALDNLAAGQSTFMVEMQETASILNNASAESLVIMDEIGRGTSTYDGMSIAWAVAEYLHDLHGHGVKTLFATHYHELTALADEKPRIRNFNIAVKEWNEEIIFLRKLVPGGANRSYGIQVARLAGIPAPVIERARNILADIENDTSLERIKIGGKDSPEHAADVPVQLELFKPPEADIIESLLNIDLVRTTPMEAINCLNRLQEKARRLKG